MSDLNDRCAEFIEFFYNLRGYATRKETTSSTPNLHRTWPGSTETSQERGVRSETILYDLLSEPSVTWNHAPEHYRPMHHDLMAENYHLACMLYISAVLDDFSDSPSDTSEYFEKRKTNSILTGYIEGGL